MMNTVSICGMCIVCAIVSLALKRYNPELSLLAATGAGAAAAVFIIGSISPAVGEIKNLLDMAQLDGAYSQTLFKSLGICLLCQLSSDICDDAGEKALGSKIILAGKAAVLLLTLPMVKMIAQTALELISGE